VTESNAGSGRRIAILGPTASGKSRLGRRLGERLGVRVVELDALLHRPNWQPSPLKEFREAVTGALDDGADAWVCVGNYTSRVGDIVLARAQTILWLRLPFWLTFWRLLKRTVARAWSRELLWGTNRESWRKSFLSRESILWWSITQRTAHFDEMRRALERIEHNAELIELWSDEDVEEFVASLNTGRPSD
jgi:adenylate kinase family enzyme